MGEPKEVEASAEHQREEIVLVAFVLFNICAIELRGTLCALLADVDCTLQ